MANPIQMPGVTTPVKTQGDQIVAVCYTCLGIPYLYGGSTRAGFDCSGLYQYCCGAVGISIPRTTETQVNVGKAVTRETALPGDAVFYGPGGITGSGVNGHVGIYIGGGKMINAPHTGTVVRIDDVVTGFGAESISGWRRVWDDTGVAGNGDTGTNGANNIPNAPQLISSSGDTECLLPINWPSAAGIGGGTTCLFYAGWARALLGALLITGGSALLLAGAVVMIGRKANVGMVLGNVIK